MNCARWPICWTATLFITLSFPPLSGSAAADYTLRPGDVLELVVAGVPELRQRSAIGIDGDVSFPLVGQQKAGGSTVAKLRQGLLSDFSSKIFQQRTSDGREVAHVILPEEISLSVVEYRSIYLNGDVARSGEQVYKPGLTIRQAVAVAGGYDIARFRMNNPVLESADLRAEYQSLWTEYAREVARQWRVRTELGQNPGPIPLTQSVPLATDVIQKLISTEEEHLSSRVTELRKERANLQAAIKRVGTQINLLAEKRKKDEEGNAADVADFERAREMSQRGMASNMRISETRRAALMSSTQLLQTLVETSNMERQGHDYAMALERLDSQRRNELLRDMQDGNVRLEQITARLRSVGEKLLYSSTLQSQLLRGSGGVPEFAVFRAGEDRGAAANENTQLQPGDTVSVTLNAGIYAGNLDTRN